MTKTQMIKRLKELSQILGRKLDTTGSEDELALRLQEAEAEASALSEDDDATGTQNDGTDGNAAINGPNDKPVSQNAGADEQSAGVASEPETASVARVKARMLRTVSMDAWHEHNDAPESLLLAGSVYRIYPLELEQLERAGLAEPD